jgi:inward rectifier potassium channel
MSKVRNHSVEDPGTGVKYKKKTKRVVNPDGSFNVIRQGMGYSFKNLYQKLINMSWWLFTLMVIATYFTINIGFALIYFSLGVENISGTIGETPTDQFIEAFQFSYQTFTTVGYGALSPVGFWTNLIAATQSMFGFMGFAIATGILYGRFSKPSASIEFSENMLMTTLNKKPCVMFRIGNRRNSILSNIKTKVLYTALNTDGSNYNRKYFLVELERDNIMFFPLNWTLVHYIDQKSPFYGKSPQQIEEEQGELLILVTGFDETFSQEVQTRYSYVSKDIVWNAKFTKAYWTNEEGDIIFNLKDLHHFEKMKT